MTFDLGSIDLFPTVNEQNHPASGMSIQEWSMLELGLTRMAAAAALAGDPQMGRALASALTPLIEFHMTRWPKVKLNDEVAAKADFENIIPNTPSAVPAAESEATSPGEESPMDQKENKDDNVAGGIGESNMGQAGTGRDTVPSADRDESQTLIDTGADNQQPGEESVVDSNNRDDENQAPPDNDDSE